MNNRGKIGFIACYINDQGPYLYLNDHLGSTRMVIDTNRTVLADFSYLASGDATNEIPWMENVETPVKFTSKELDDEGSFGLYYFGARYYDPVICRWKAGDPAGQFASPYSYGGGAIMSGNDPNGRFFIAPALLFIMGSAITYAQTNDVKASLLGGALTVASFGLAEASISASAALFAEGGAHIIAGAAIQIPNVMITASMACELGHSGTEWTKVLSYYATGGYFMESVGHAIGLMTWSRPEFYKGYWVYQHGLFWKNGFAGETWLAGTGGTAIFGHAIFISNDFSIVKPGSERFNVNGEPYYWENINSRNALIAHEIRHVRDEIHNGGPAELLAHYPPPFFPFYEYGGYYNYGYEIDAFWSEYLYLTGKIDLYGNKTGEITDDTREGFKKWLRTMSGGFYNYGDPSGY